MTTTPSESRPQFSDPPVVETLLGVQFAPLFGFKSHHYGWFWRECLLADGWEPVADLEPLPTWTEEFDHARLRLFAGKVGDDKKTKAVRLKLRNKGSSRSLQIQPDKLYYSWLKSDDSPCPKFELLTVELRSIMDRFVTFLKESDGGDIQANLWEVQYINVIHSGTLWNEPNDWHRVLPLFFPSHHGTWDDCRFSTFDGDWHYEIAPKQGRIHARVAKMIVNQQVDNPVLFYHLTARGEVGGMSGVREWERGLEIGHRSCNKLFLESASEEAKIQWGLKR